MRAVGIRLSCMLGDPKYRIGSVVGPIGHVADDMFAYLCRPHMLNEDGERMFEVLHGGNAHPQRR